SCSALLTAVVILYTSAFTPISSLHNLTPLAASSAQASAPVNFIISSSTLPPPLIILASVSPAFFNASIVFFFRLIPAVIKQLIPTISGLCRSEERRVGEERGSPRSRAASRKG